MIRVTVVVKDYIQYKHKQSYNRWAFEVRPEALLSKEGGQELKEKVSSAPKKKKNKKKESKQEGEEGAPQSPTLTV